MTQRYCEKHGAVDADCWFTVTINGRETPKYCADCVAEMFDTHCCILTDAPMPRVPEFEFPPFSFGGSAMKITDKCESCGAPRFNCRCGGTPTLAVVKAMPPEPQGFHPGLATLDPPLQIEPNSFVVYRTEFDQHDVEQGHIWPRQTQRELFRITGDGKVVVGPGVTMDDCAKTLFDCLASHAGTLSNRLAQAEFIAANEMGLAPGHPLRVALRDGSGAPLVEPTYAPGGSPIPDFSEVAPMDPFSGPLRALNLPDVPLGWIGLLDGGKHFTRHEVKGPSGEGCVWRRIDGVGDTIDYAAGGLSFQGESSATGFAPRAWSIKDRVSDLGNGEFGVRLTVDGSDDNGAWVEICGCDKTEAQRRAEVMVAALNRAVDR